MTVLIFHVTMTFWVGPSHPDSATYKGPWDLWMWRWNVLTWHVTTWSMWSMWSVWLCRWGPLIVSHHPDKFGVHRPCESGDITFFICHVTTILKRHVTFWVGPLSLNHHPARFGVHRPNGTGNNGVCSISSNCNCNCNFISNAEVPVLRFTNGPNLRIAYESTPMFNKIMIL